MFVVNYYVLNSQTDVSQSPPEITHSRQESSYNNVTNSRQKELPKLPEQPQKTNLYDNKSEFQQFKVPDNRRNTVFNNSKKTYKRVQTDDSFLSDETRQNRAVINEKVGENYADSILLNGKLLRWNPSTFPLKVYIENNSNLPPYYYKQIRKAFERWQSISGNFITFKFTDSKTNADIRCVFPPNIERKCGVSNVAAWHNYKIENNLIKYSEIKFAKVSCQKTLYSPETIYGTALHEIGHSLGINGHSSNPHDLMYPVSSRKKEITDNDIRTLKLVYSIIPDISNAQFSDNDKRGLITSDDVWGDKNGRIEIQLRDIKNKVKNVPSSSYAEYVQMGNLYYQKEDYYKAIENYKNSLKIATDKTTISAINARISSAYIKMKDYEEALKYAETAYEYNPDDDGIANIARIKFELGDYEKAKSMLRSLLNRNPKVYNAYIILCNIYLKEKDYKAAMSLYERGKRNFPDNPPIKFSK